MPPPGGSAQDDLLQRLLTGQGSTDQRFEELFRRLDKAEKTAGEARDIAREIVTTLREQNALVKIQEVRDEARSLVAALRSDLVLSVKNLRGDYDPAVARIDALEASRDKGAGMARGLKLALEIGKVIASAGGGALLLKLLGH